VAVSFIGGGNRSTWRKPPTCQNTVDINGATLARSSLDISGSKHIFIIIFLIKKRL